MAWWRGAKPEPAETGEPPSEPGSGVEPLVRDPVVPDPAVDAEVEALRREAVRRLTAVVSQNPGLYLADDPACYTLAGVLLTQALHADPTLARGAELTAQWRREGEAVEADLRRRAHLPDRDELRALIGAATRDDYIGECLLDAVDAAAEYGLPAGAGRPAAPLPLGLLRSATEETTVVRVGGVELPVGYASPEFVTDQHCRWALLDDVYVFVRAGRLGGAEQIVPAMELVLPTGGSLLVVADEIVGEALVTLEVNALRSTIRALAVTAPEGSDADRRAVLANVAQLTGATVSTGDPSEQVTFGRVQRVIADSRSTVLLGVGDTPERSQLGAGVVALSVGDASDRARRHWMHAASAGLAAARPAMIGGILDEPRGALLDAADSLADDAMLRAAVHSGAWWQLPPGPTPVDATVYTVQRAIRAATAGVLWV